MSRKRDTFDLLRSDPQVSDVLFARLTTEETKRPFEVCAEMGLSWGAVLAWCNEDEERVKRLWTALGVRAHLLAEGTLEIADATENSVGRDRLRVDTRFRLAEAYAPRVYGKRRDLEAEKPSDPLLQERETMLLEIARNLAVTLQMGADAATRREREPALLEMEPVESDAGTGQPVSQSATPTDQEI